MEAAKPSPGSETKNILREALAQITQALERQDMTGAVEAMRAANEACAVLNGRGIALNREELPTFQSLAVACGEALQQSGQELQAASNRRENIRRGMSAYLRNEE